MRAHAHAHARTPTRVCPRAGYIAEVRPYTEAVRAVYIAAVRYIEEVRHSTQAAEKPGHYQCPPHIPA